MAWTANSNLQGNDEINDLFADGSWATKFPHILTLDEAADLIRVPKNTIYSCSSQGLLKDCSFRAGRYLRIYRNKFLQKLTEGRLYGS